MEAPTQVDTRIGLVLNGRYSVSERLGEGGMGVVYRGNRLQLDRPVAIKFLHSPYASSAKFVARFDREARAMSRLSHPCCVSVIDFGMHDAPYIVMDFAPGDTLRTVLDDQRFTPQRAVQVTRQILSGLAHAHEQGIIHRDIKPGNIMLGEATGMGDHVRIFDFGLAKLLDPSDIGDPSTTGVIGTPSYMAPEQTRGDKLDARVDLYAVGVVLFELLTGQKPFDAPDTLAVLRMHREQPAPRARDLGAEISAELESVVAKALEKEPGQRYQSAAEFMAALDAVPEATGRPSSEKARDELALAPTQAVESPRLSPSRGDSTTGSSMRREDPSGRRLAYALVGLACVGLIAWATLRRERGPDSMPTTTAAPVVADTQAASPEAKLEGTPEAKPGAVPVAAAPEPDKPVEPPPTEVAAAPAEEIADWARTDSGVYELSEEDLAAADEALNDPADSEARAPANEASDVKSLSDVRALMHAGKIDEAIAGVRVLRRRDPRNPELPYLLGDLYFQKGFWSDGLSRYRQALSLRRGLRTRSSVQRNAIAALGGDKTYARARALILRDLGSSAIERLRVAQKRDSSATVRARAKSVLSQLTNATPSTKRKRGWFW